MMQFLPSMREQKMNEIIQYLTNNLTLPFIFILGMFHALEPGHGKTFILAYLTGGKIRVWGALQLIIALIIYWIQFHSNQSRHQNSCPIKAMLECGVILPNLHN